MRAALSAVLLGITLAVAVLAGAPPKVDSCYSIKGDAQAGKLDLVALCGNTAGIGHWHTQVNPGLDVGASPSKVSGPSTSMPISRVLGVPGGPSTTGIPGRYRGSAGTRPARVRPETSTRRTPHEMTPS